MSEKLNLLALVRRHLLSRNEDYQWVTMGPQAEKIGLAYLPVDATGMPCTFMFTELQEPCSLVFDVHFCTRVAAEHRQELGLLLLTLNANLPEGHQKLVIFVFVCGVREITTHNPLSFGYKDR